MNQYLIYNTETGIIKSAIKSSNFPSNDIPDGFSCLQSEESFQGKMIDTKTNNLIASNAELPFPLTFAGKLRTIRGGILIGSDWTQFSDSPLTIEKKAEWATYRQALRDIPATYSDADSLDAIIWPIQPEV
tara:strand:+ start:778 stop:1170 length:393 start_codon:yes stop_codon:yes gene_type:complete